MLSNPNGITRKRGMSPERSASRNDAPPGRGAAQNADFHAIYFAGRNILSIFAGLKTRKGERFFINLIQFYSKWLLKFVWHVTVRRVTPSITSLPQIAERHVMVSSSRSWEPTTPTRILLRSICASRKHWIGYRKAHNPRIPAGLSSPTRAFSTRSTCWAA